MAMHPAFPDSIPRAFGLDGFRHLPDIELPGSPERCAVRWALETGDRRRYVLERLLLGQATRRETLASLVRHLADNGLDQAVAWLPVVDSPGSKPKTDGYGSSIPTGPTRGTGHPSRPSPADQLRPGSTMGTGPSPSLRPYPGVVRNPHLEPELALTSPLMARFVLHDSGAAWMLSPYVENQPLPRPAFLDHAQRGAALADFLAGMRKASEGLEQDFLAPLERLDLPSYGRELARTIQDRRPELATRLGPVLAALEPLFEAWDDLPLALNHGDFHPLNVLWRDQAIAGVIDWEFAGLKPELYDAANLLGCCGFEHPRAFSSGLVPAFLRGLKDHGLLTPDNVPWLPSLVLGLRLAWLSEWLRKKDEDMLDLELTYLSMLTDSLPDMARAWRV